MERKAQRGRQGSAVWRGRQVTDDNDKGIRVSSYGEGTLRESMSQMTLQAEGKVSGYPERPGQPDCGHYMRTGFCGYGINCRFNHPTTAIKQVDRKKGEHPERVGQSECQYFLRTGTCKFGANCKYLHPHDKAGIRHTQLNMLGFPMRMGERECTYYMHTGSCKYGASCKFDHPQFAALGSYVPLSGSSVYSTVGSPLVPSSRAQHSHSISTWPSSQTGHVQESHIQGQPPYMPVIYSPQQGILSAPVWGMYQGLAGHMTSERQQLQGIGMHGVAQPNHPYVGGAQGIFTQFVQGYSTAIVPQTGQYLATPNLVGTYPERSGQTDCQHYITTGDCKFGSACRYQHPQGRVSESIACVLSPLGLPIRPTQPTCTYYKRRGICKFGPTCRYNHPMPAISYSPSSSSLSDLPVVPYPRVSSPTTTLVQCTSSETSQEIRNNGEGEPLRDLTRSDQDCGTVHSVDIIASEASPSSHVSILSKTV
ncbi:hypothetical protein SUGI_0622090 [Cryptomeria japonica]|uniref:zinc finger CCCH domain-containing protein 58 isoform X1 n=2 Tax=Cryptomeria japonica TaxID=3369 RepID=UPI00241475C6|nr:zinc finger CCCH domain-containing protein 58 isoform X1 [Cryptomeria japonica]GLJ31081.1 hypothetical protein SUGI_0622090 [Cryptomeria japonica]